MKHWWLILILLLALAGFAAGLSHLFSLRFERGDVYPPYSSLRPDPLGTEALFDSFAELPGLTVKRDLSTSEHYGKGPGEVLLLIGTEPLAVESAIERVVLNLERWINRGGRLVIAFGPRLSRPRFPLLKKDAKKTEPEKKEGQSPKDREKDDFHYEPMVSLCERWGVTLAFSSGLDLRHLTAKPADGAPAGLGAPLSWHSIVWFDKLDAAWKTVFTRAGRPVIISRAWGAGSIVWCADSYLFSNEALRSERRPELLAWIVGPAPREITFDETHLGVTSTPSLAMLARKYGLHWLLAVLAVLAALFVWKNTISFLPAASAAAREDLVSGQDSVAGLASLLGRNIHPQKLLEVCCREWWKTQPSGSKNARLKEERMKTVVQDAQKKSARKQGLAAPYAELCKIAAER